MECTPVAVTSASPEFYSLRKLASRSSPTTMEDLQHWLSKQHRRGEWDAKLYVAHTIEWSDDPPEFRQRGCSPNYQAGLWSLSCCKHSMRRAKPFRGQVEDETIPTFVFTLTRKSATGFQALVSIAKVTEHFETMGEYARFLLDLGKRKLISSRLTRVHESDDLMGWRFGDCHANQQGRIGAPDADHVHAPENCWKADLDGTHLILASSKFLIWDRPIFVAKKTIGRSRYGKSLTAENLEEILTCK